MKKTIILLGLILTATASHVFSQDTLHKSDMRLVPNLYVYGWPDKFKPDPRGIHDGEYGTVMLAISGSDGMKQFAWKVFTNDTIKVYGIAAGLSTTMQWNADDYANDPWVTGGADTSLEYSSVFLRLYEADEDSLRYLGDEQEVHMLYTPVSYYVDFDLWNMLFINKWPAVPVYERYFSSPFIMTDSFYVGTRFRSDHTYNDFNSVFHISVSNHMQTNPTTRSAILLDYWNVNMFTGERDYYYHFWYYFPDNSYYYMIFPIIAPPDNTIPVDTTGVAVEKPDMVYRYTSVAPNPATDRVRVTSSFGLQDIVAYNEAGSKVYEGKASGMVATLDVSAWPRGAYLLRITTPMGTTVKKLLVQ